jgi:hypothetical protein
MGVVVKKETARQTDTSKADWKSAVLAGWLAHSQAVVRAQRRRDVPRAESRAGVRRVRDCRALGRCAQARAA